MNDEISAIELKERLDNGDELVIIDCRESYEVQIGAIKGSIHIPMNQIPVKMQELDKNKEYVIQCRSGNRSRHVLNYMKQHGFESGWNLTGGLISWAMTVDPEIRIG
jgi:rhodanese-related sulfurtransferase